MVTVAIPFYNAEQFLAQAIESVLAQTYADWKLILLDDGSKDNSLNIAQAYAEKDSRITVLSDGENRNLGYRLNQIPFMIETEYLARMDADDIMHPERIEKQLNILTNNPNIDVLGTNAYTIDEDNNVVGVRKKFSNPDSLDKVEGFIHPTVMAKTEWFRQNPYDVKAVRIEDLELWYRTASKYNFMMLSEPLLYYREIGKNYYRKYFLANTCKRYILTKYPNDSFWKKFFLLNVLKGCVYWLYNLFGKEQVLVNKRNQLKVESVEVSY